MNYIFLCYVTFSTLHLVESALKCSLHTDVPFLSHSKPDHLFLLHGHQVIKLFLHLFFTYVDQHWDRHKQQFSSGPDRNPWAHMGLLLVLCSQAQNMDYDQWICHRLGRLPGIVEDYSNSKLFHSLRHCAHSPLSHQSEPAQVAQG